MAQNYLNVEQAAEGLGVTPEQVNQLRERRELHGYRDGTNWKFKREDIERKAAELKEGGGFGLGDDEEGDVLLSELALGGSGPSASGTVIGMDLDDQRAEASDIKLSDQASASSKKQPSVKPAAPKSPAAKLDDLDLTLDEDLALADSDILSAGAKSGKKPAERKPGDSSLDLSAKGEGINDDDMVLGGSGSGSDVTIASDSGINLVDPSEAACRWKSRPS
jgi:excisionase family DNA binding protein